MTMEYAAPFLLMKVVLPLLVLAGLLDWACHRATRIERTAGLQENLVHWLMFGQIGVGVLAVAVFELTAAVLLVVALVFVVHELTVYLELRYTVSRREVRPVEQAIHSFMEILPLAALLLLLVMPWQRTLDFNVRAQPWPLGYTLWMAAAVLLMNVLPLAEETIRCLRARRATA